jgi:hypothetical protein
LRHWRVGGSGLPGDWGGRKFLRTEVGRHRVDAIGVSGVDVGIVFVPFADWIVGYVEELVAKVVCVSYAMVVIPTVPYLPL